MLLNVLIPLVGIVVDQLVKYWASVRLRAVGTIPLWEGAFHLTYCENTGAAFSLLSGQRWLLLAVTVLLLAGLLYVLHRNWLKNAFGRTGLRLIISGAVGNMIDRFLLGYVVDLFDFRLIHFPIFNVADILLCVGVGMIAVYILLMEPRLEKQAKEAEADGDSDADRRA